MLKDLLRFRSTLRDLGRVADALEQLVRIEALRMQHETGNSALFMLEKRQPGAPDGSAISAPDYAYISAWQAARATLYEQLQREPSEEEVMELLEGPQMEAVPS